MRKLFLVLFSISVVHFSGISQNVFPTTGNASIYGFNYLKTGYTYLQFPANISNNYTRGIFGQDIYWDNSNAVWQIPNTSGNDFSLLRYEIGGDIGFYGLAGTGAAYTMTDAQLNATCKMLISASGKIGIGTKLPQSELHLIGNGTLKDVTSQYSGDFIIQSNTGGRSTTKGAQLEFAIPANIDGTNIWGQSRILTVAANTTDANQTGKMILGTRRIFSKLNTGSQWYYGDDITIDGSGNVGINNVNPYTKLMVSGGSLDVSTNSGQYTLSQVDNNTGSPMGSADLMGLNAGDLMMRSYWGVSVDLNNGLLGDNSSAQYTRIPNTSSFTINTRSSATSFTNLFTVRNSGNVGIGTSAPAAMLQVTGNVLIGTASSGNPINASYLLDVKGSVRANVLTVNINGADFVFEPSYKLMPLKEVELFVQNNHHLPGIASATEMQKDGVDVGNNQNKLLQKIEELTLYLIELKKENTEMKEDIKKLKSKIND